MVIVLMGVSGAGKTTIGRLLAQQLGWTFYDADDFHPADNIEKMRLGEPLSDADRLPWLEKLRELVNSEIKSEANLVLACSALKRPYRDYLLIDAQVKLVYLKGDASLIDERLRRRSDHYMNPSLLDSQLATLEEPVQAVTIDIAPPPEDIVQTIRAKLGV